MRFFNLSAPDCFGAGRVSSQKQVAKSQNESESTLSTDYKELGRFILSLLLKFYSLVDLFHEFISFAIFCKFFICCLFLLFIN